MTTASTDPVFWRDAMTVSLSVETRPIPGASRNAVGKVLECGPPPPLRRPRSL